MPEFLRVHTSSLNEWQRMAYEWCVANPSRMLVLTSMKLRLIYHIAKRGEYIEFGLPHHCHGGEKYWVSRNGKTKVLINRRLSTLAAQFQDRPELASKAPRSHLSDKATIQPCGSLSLSVSALAIWHSLRCRLRF